MNRTALLRRVELLERRLQPPPTFAAKVLATATDEQLEAIEIEALRDGPWTVWDALVAAYEAGESRL